MGDAHNAPLFNVLVTMLQLPLNDVGRLHALREERLSAATSSFSLGGLLGEAVPPPLSLTFPAAPPSRPVAGGRVRPPSIPR